MNTKIYSGYISLGCIIKGQTYHFEILSNECIRSINSLVLEHNVPIGFGIIGPGAEEEQITKRVEAHAKQAVLAVAEMLST